LVAPPTYPIAALQELLSNRVGIELSSIELAEILWLALQKGATEPPPEGPTPSPEPGRQERTLPPDPPPKEPEPSPGAAVVTEPPEPVVEGKESGTAQPEGIALPVRIPEAIALRNRREIARSFRPLMRKVPSKHRQVINEEATVIQFAETQTWSPVVQPEPERWLELAIVIEVTNIIDVWQDTIAEFQHLLERHGAFSNVRTWQLKANAAGEPQLFLQTAAGLKRKARNPRELLDASGRRLILFLSDCTSRAWRSGKIPELLELWSRENPLTVVQLLPEPYWDRSALGLTYPVALRARRTGALSRDWILEGLSPWRRRRIPKGLKLPVVTLQPLSLKRWANAIAALSEQQTMGVVLDFRAFAAENSVSPPTEPLTAKQLVRQFRATASQPAQELADMMAVLPVNWSVIRLVQKNWLQKAADVSPETGTLYLAEIFLSGLLRPTGQKRSSAQQYDFVEGVRDLLVSWIPISEGQEVMAEIAEAVFKQLPQEIQDRVNADIERRYGESLSYFEAFLIPDLPWGEAASADIFSIAKVTGQVLRKWGGDYAALAERLERTPKNQESTSAEDLPAGWPAGFPRPKTLPFEVATIAIEIDLQSFEFEMATVTQPRQRIIQELSDPVNAFQQIDEAVYHFANKHLSEIEQAIFIQSWNDVTYERMGINLDYHPRYLRTEAGTLWNLLSQVTGEKVHKATLQEAVLQWATADVPDVSIQRQQRQGQQFIEDLGDGVTLAMVAIPGGSFEMGSPEDEPERYDNEGPQHTVTVPPFFISKYPITQAQWQAISQLPQHNRSLEPDPSRFIGSNRPVEYISWFDAVEFCDRLSTHTGRDYRLPSEAVWEYACRAGTTTPFHFGETITPELANYNGNFNLRASPQGEYRQETTDVGSYPANAFGLRDMHGNVWEWCLDHWHDNYEDPPTDGSAWLTEDQEALRVLRGGSWSGFPRYCRSAYRGGNDPGIRDDYIGFRVVCVTPALLSV
jgi:formylglycine-generating enzyme required for sulfatase activity